MSKHVITGLNVQCENVKMKAKTAIVVNGECSGVDWSSLSNTDEDKVGCYKTFRWSTSTLTKYIHVYQAYCYTQINLNFNYSFQTMSIWNE